VLRSRFGPALARFSSERLFRLQFARIFSPGHPLTADEAADQWALLDHLGGNRIIDRLTYYLHERVAFAERWHGAIRDWPGGVELAWAGRDPVCVEAVLTAVLELRPNAPLTRWAELGHYPQLEDAAIVGAVLAAFATS
jgi:pimeloyl-ACP methyl ester carboxylesterase